MSKNQSRQTRIKNQVFHEKPRGKSRTVKKDDSLGVGPVVIGFFLFVVVGSALLQIIRGAM